MRVIHLKIEYLLNHQESEGAGSMMREGIKSKEVQRETPARVYIVIAWSILRK
jgi:hypothetical protein